MSEYFINHKVSNDRQKQWDKMKEYVKRFKIDATIDYDPEDDMFYLYSKRIEFYDIRTIAKSVKLKIDYVTAAYDMQKKEPYMIVEMAEQF